jgi:hypothetical protein
MCKYSDDVVGRTLKDSDSRGEVVDAPRSADSGGDHRRRGDEIVGEAVVQVSLCSCQPVGPLHSVTPACFPRHGLMLVGFKSCVIDVPGARKHR